MSPSPILQHLGHALIRASAGTGKTHALTTRYAQWVAQGIEPQHIIAITFTRKAAAELRFRIRAALTAQGESEALLQQLHHAPITNFHGLCLQLCEEFSPGGLTDQAVQVLGESGEDKQLFLECCESIWFAGHPKMAAALNTVSPYMMVDSTLMARLWEALSLARESDRPLTEALFGSYDAQGVAAEVHQHMLNVRGHILAHEHELNTAAGLKALAHLLHTQVPTLPRGRQDIPGWQQAWQSMFAPINRKGRMGRIVDADQLLSITTLLPSVMAEQHAQNVAPALYVLAKAAWDAYQAAKAARGAVDFADLIERAIAVLSQRPDALKMVRERTAAVLVDEAQDTNALQRRLVHLLALQAPLPPAATTIVGDWKQAIYTFRGADPKNFSRFAEDLQNLGGQAHSLATSYRSVPQLVYNINDLGQHLFGDSYDELMALPAEPEATKSDAPATQPFLGMRWLPVQRQNGGRLTVADDAWATAQCVAKLVQSGTQPQHIALLLANVRSAAPTYLKAFSAARVPLVASSTGDLLEQPYVAELIALCVWLTDESDHAALDGATALSAAWFALDEDDLFALWGPEGRALQRVKLLRAGDHAALAASIAYPLSTPLARACALVPNLLSLAQHCTLPALLRHVDQQLHVRALCCADPAVRAQRLADFDALLRLAELATRHGHCTVADGVSHLLWRKTQGLTTAQGDGTLTQQHAVQLCSVHASKGLQYPVVVLPALERRGQMGAGALIFERDTGIAFALRTGGERLRPRRYLQAASAMAEAQSLELKRLLYVAVTRAKQQVIFIGPPVADCSNTGFAGILSPWAAASQTLHTDEPITVPEQLAEPASPPAVWRPASPTQGDVGASAYAQERARKRLSTLLTDTPPMKLPLGTHLTLSVSALLDAVSLTGRSPAQNGPQASLPLQGAPQARAQQAGILAHALLARLDDLSLYSSTQQFIDGQLLFLGRRLDDAVAQEVARHVMAALDAPTGQWLQATAPQNRAFERELLWNGTIMGYQVQLRGQVDVLIQDPSGLTLLDFKYGAPSRQASRYRQQLQVYAWALKALRGPQGAPKRAKIFYLQAPEGTHDVAIDEAACSWVPLALEAWVRQTCLRPTDAVIP